MGDDYERPDFCFSCGAPFPWVSRQGRIYELQNLLDDEELDPATELRVRETLEQLAEDPDSADEIGSWQAVRSKAPAFWEKSGVQRILITLIEAEAKKKLGL